MLRDLVCDAPDGNRRAVHQTQRRIRHIEMTLVFAKKGNKSKLNIQHHYRVVYSATGLDLMFTMPCKNIYRHMLYQAPDAPAGRINLCSSKRYQRRRLWKAVVQPDRIASNREQVNNNTIPSEIEAAEEEKTTRMGSIVFDIVTSVP